MLNLYGEQFDNLCTEINRCIANTGTISPQNESTSEQFARQLSADVLLYGDLFSFYYLEYDSNNPVLYTASNVTYAERSSVLKLLKQLTDYNCQNEWCILTDENSISYIMRFYQQDHYFVGAWISLDNALNLYANNQFADGSILFFSDADGQALTNSSALQNLGNQLYNPSYVDKTYLSISKAIVHNNLFLSLLIPYDAILSKFAFINLVQVLMFIAFILGLLLLFFYIYQLIFKPLITLEKAMHEVEGGNYKIQITEKNSSKEFQAVNAAFNSMVKEIDYLKVSIYEREIFNQKLELEKMQLQVKPHFYLNCLNIIFNLAQGGEFKLIQELCMAQIHYFRYMMKSSFTTVSIKEEFDHIRNYLHIQQLRYPGRYDVELSLKNELEDVRIPPLILHVFAENVINHVSTYGKIHFSIIASTLKADPMSAGFSNIPVGCSDDSIPSDDYVQIVITDDGPGYPDEIIEKLQNGELIFDDNNTHIGINNTIKRLKLSYKENCRIEFCNHAPHGAQITIVIPNIQSADPTNKIHN